MAAVGTLQPVQTRSALNEAQSIRRVSLGGSNRPLVLDV